MGRIKLGRAEGRAGGAGGRDTEPEAGGPGWARGAPARGLRPPVAQRCPGGGEGGRPRYLEDEGGPRAGSHRCRAPPTHPGSSPGPGPPRPSGAPGGARSPESGRGSEAPTEKPGTRRPVQQWRRGGSASPHEGPGRPGRGAGGKRDAGNAGAPGSGRSCAQTEPRPAIGAPLRRPGAGGEEGRGGESGGRGRGRGGGAAALSSHLPKAPRRTLAPRLLASAAPARHPRGRGWGSAPAPPPPIARVSPPGPRHPGRAPRSAGRRARHPSARPPGARPEIAGLPTSKGRPAHQSARAARRRGLALTRGPRARSAPRPRGRPGQGPGPGPRIGSPPRSQAPPGRTRCRGAWGGARPGRECGEPGGEGGGGAPGRPASAEDPSGPRPAAAALAPRPRRPGFRRGRRFQQPLRAPHVLPALPTKTAPRTSLCTSKARAGARS